MSTWKYFTITPNINDQSGGPREEPQEEEERRGEVEGNDEGKKVEVVDDDIGELRVEL
jgi:hypothetical protein